MGGSLICSDHPQYNWETPSDFLLSYLITTLGKDWCAEERKRPTEKQHEIVKWFSKGRSNINQNSNLKWDVPNGNALALLHLAYDLFVLDNQNNLPERLVNRLKDIGNFNGARYEAFVFATLVRAGFEIEYLDETSGKNGKVAECRARHITSAEYMSVEAKTRNVKGVFNAGEGNPLKIKLYSNLRKAVEKNICEPYILFVDLNLPEFDVFRNEQIIKKIRAAHQRLGRTHPDDLPNLICYTNIPFHYGEISISPNQSAFAFVTFRKPKVKLKNHEMIIKSIRDSVDKYAFLPKEFNEAENFANKSI